MNLENMLALIFTNLHSLQQKPAIQYYYKYKQGELLDNLHYSLDMIKEDHN